MKTRLLLTTLILFSSTTAWAQSGKEAKAPIFQSLESRSRSLRSGHRGDDVRELQRRLAALGYDTVIDGVFGPKTRASVRRFQSDHGLKADGVFGKKSLQALIAAERKLAPPNPTPTPPPVSPPVDLSAAIRQMVADNRASFGVSASQEKLSANFYTKGRSNTLRVLKVSNIETYLKKYQANEAHIQKALTDFGKSGLALYTSGEDVPFILAIATRESGGNVFRADSQQVVSGGKDTHKKGASGLDNLWTLNRYFKLNDGSRIGIRKVSKSDPGLKKPNRNPAWLAAKHLLFAHLLTTARHEQHFRGRLIGLKTKKLAISQSPDVLFAGLTKEARRTWLALHYSGYGYVMQTIEHLFKAQLKAGQKPDLNGILTHHFNGFKPKARVILARATALRAKIFETLK